MGMASPVCERTESHYFHSADLTVRSDGREKTAQTRSDRLAESAKLTVLSPNHRHFIAFLIALVPEVESVFTAAHDNLLHVYAVVNDFDASIREKIYDKELEIIGNFEKFDFDFNIISRRGRPLSEYISDLELSFQR